MTRRSGPQAADQPIQVRKVAKARSRARTLEGLSKDSSKDFGSVEFHHQRMDAFASITDEWDAVADTARARTAIAAWAQRHPALASYRSPADLVATINRPGHPELSCALLADLLVVAEDDPLAQLAVLQALLPGVLRVVSRRWKTASGSGPWTAQADLAADTVSAAWEAIRQHAGEHHCRPARLIVRRVERRLRTVHDAHRRETLRLVPILDSSSVAATHECRAEEEFAAAIEEAVATGQLDRATVAVAYRVAILGESARMAGHRHRLAPGEARDSLRLVLDVLAGETRAPRAGQPSRPPLPAEPEEDPVMRPVHHDPNTGPKVERAAITPLLLTVKQAAALLGIGRSTLYELLDAGQLRSVKVGASRRVPLQEVHGYIDRLLDAEEGPTGAVTSAS